MHSGRARRGRSAKRSTSPRKKSPLTGPVAQVVASVMALVGVIITAVVTIAGKGDEKPRAVATQGTSETAASINLLGLTKPVDLVVHDPVEGGSEDAPPVAFEITVHNIGQRRSAITRIDVIVESSWKVVPCHTEGGGPLVSGTYDLRIPVDVPVGTEFRVPVSQLENPDEVDRFALRVGPDGETELISPTLLRLRLALEADGASERIPVGSAVVGFPELPNNTHAALYWSKSYSEGADNLHWLGDAEAESEIESCMKRNSVKLKSFLEGAELSPLAVALQQDLRA